MAKAKAKGKGQNAQSHIQSRISYLYNAATLLQSATLASAKIPSENPELDSKQSRPDIEEDPNPPQEDNNKQSQKPSTAIPKQKDQVSYLGRQYTAQLRSVSLKAQLRLDRQTKRSICKRCDTVLVPGSTCWEVVENRSRGKQKPWADVRVVRCGFCGTPKRYPQQGSRRSLKLVERRKVQSEMKDGTHADDAQG